MKKAIVLIMAILFIAGMVYIEDTQAMPVNNHTYQMGTSNIKDVGLYKHIFFKKHHSGHSKNSSGYTQELFAENENEKTNFNFSTEQIDISNIPEVLRGTDGNVFHSLLADSSAMFKQKASLTIRKTRN